MTASISPVVQITYPDHQQGLETSVLPVSLPSLCSGDFLEVCLEGTNNLTTRTCQTLITIKTLVWTTQWWVALATSPTNKQEERRSWTNMTLTLVTLTSRKINSQILHMRIQLFSSQLPKKDVSGRINKNRGNKNFPTTIALHCWVPR